MMPDYTNRYVLLQARNPGDSVIEEERVAFAERLQVPVSSITTVDMLTADLNDGILDGAAALLVGGAGEYSVIDAEPPILRAIDFLGRAVESSTPIFASCFGFQCIVVALGGEVIHDVEGAEVGSKTISLTDAGRKDPLFSLLPSEFIAQQGHKDRASRLPDCAVALAENATAPFQALTIKGRPVYATQFHPELTGATNRGRFERYIDDYGEVFGAERAMEMLKEFLPSPEASSLLLHFKRTFVEA
jgi:GMP synthase (glutamine-hydrolysing)